MPVDIFNAAIKGDRDVLIPRLGLQPKESTQIQETIQMEQTVQSELQSATRFGDTVLHLLVTRGEIRPLYPNIPNPSLLVTKRHNELALMVFQRERSLLKARNKILETPLHCAAKVGNEEVIQNLIQIDPVIIKNVLKETNKNGDTALHVAAQYGQLYVGSELMKLDPEAAYKVNDELSSPLYIAIVKGHTNMVHTMLEVDPTLACTQFSDGMYPVHVCARMGNMNLVTHFMEKYPDYVELLDPHGRNLLHIAVEENQIDFFWSFFQTRRFARTILDMIIAKDYDGNTPLHIAAIKGHDVIMRAMFQYRVNQLPEKVQNNQGLTPLILSGMRVLETNKYFDGKDISLYLRTEGNKFTLKWFDYVMQPSLKNKWERVEVIGLGSVLITTVTFAAAFTIPGGYNQDHGTPVLGRRYMFRAFILVNVLAFIQGFLSLFALLMETLTDLPDHTVRFATNSFVLAVSSMVVAFGLGSYVTLAPVCLPLAVFVLVITLFLGSPAMLIVISKGQHYFRLGYHRDSRTKCTIVAAYAMSFLLIYCLAFM